VAPAEPDVFDERKGGISGTLRGSAWRRLGVLLFVGTVLLVQLSWLGALGYGVFRALY
jgi:hypothetical protein